MLSNILSNDFDDHDYIDDYDGLDSLIKLAAQDKENDVFLLKYFPSSHLSQLDKSTSNILFTEIYGDCRE